MRLVLTLLAAASLAAAAPPGRDLDLTYRSAIDGSEQPYRLYLPSTYDGSRPFPLVFALHGTFHNQNTLFDLPRYRAFGLLEAAERRGVILLSALGRGTTEYRGSGETDIFEALADVSRRYRIDPDRIYFTGHSMGGTGSAHLAMHHPDVPAAIAAFAPAYSFPWLAENLHRVPSWWGMGLADEPVYMVGVRPGVERMRRLRNPLQFVEIHGEGHDGPMRHFDDALAWLLTQRRDPHPAAYSYTVETPLHGHAWWTTVERIAEPGRLARVEARAAGRRIELKTANVASLAITLDPAAVDLAGPVEIVHNGVRHTLGAATAGQRIRLTAAGLEPAGPAPDPAQWRRSPVTTAPAALSIDGDESPLGTWIAEAMRAATGADLAVYNRRYYRGRPIPAGPVDVVDLLQCSRPFEQYLVTARVRGAVLREILDANANDPERLIQPAGFRYTFDPGRAAGSRILETDLDPAREYLVAFEGQVPERETVLLAGHLAGLTFTKTEVPFTLALYGHAARAGELRAPADGRVRNAAAVR